MTDPYTYEDPSGRRRWVAPPDDPEPPRTDATGFLNPEWTRWDVRMSDRRQRGVLPDAGPVEPTSLELELATYDRLIAEVQDIISRAARRRVAIRGEVREVERPSRGFMDSAGRILVRIKGPEAAKRLRTEHDDLEKVIVKAKALESTLRGDRIAISSGGLPRVVQEELERSTAARAGDDQEYVVEVGQAAPPKSDKHEMYPGDSSWPRRYSAINPGTIVDGVYRP